MASLRFLDVPSCLQPLDWKIELGIRKLGASLLGAWTLSVFIIPAPGDIHDACDLLAHAVECTIVESLPKATMELLATELYVALPLSHFRLILRHRNLGPSGRLRMTQNSF